jgi:putative spermidine/putrescine transport system permease protein
LAGALFAFMTSFDEVVVAIFIAGWKAETLPMKMWGSLRTGFDPVISVVSVVVTATSVIVLTIVQRLRRPGVVTEGPVADES